MSMKILVLCAVVALALVSSSEALKCWHCIRGVDDFEKSLMDTKCQTVNCPEGTNCYVEVLAGELKLILMWCQEKEKNDSNCAHQNWKFNSQRQLGARLLSLQRLRSEQEERITRMSSMQKRHVQRWAREIPHSRLRLTRWDKEISSIVSD